MSAAAPFDWSKFGARPVKEPFDWSKFGAKPVEATAPIPEPEGFLSSAASALGIPTALPTGQDWEEIKKAAKHPIQAYLELGKRIHGAQQEAYLTGRERATQPGWANKFWGRLEMLESGIPLLGPTLVKGQEQGARGEIAGALGTGTGLGLAAALGTPTGRGALGEAAAKTTEIVRHPINTIAEIGRKPQVAQSVVKEAMALPPKAVNGVEDIFRAAAPTGGKPSFRTNMYAAAGDLAEIGKKLDLKAARGGMRNPDMRPRVTVQGINEHLKKMYQEERLPQIQRNAQIPIDPKVSADAKEGLRYLSKTAGTTESRALAAKVLESETIPLADADQLARLVNQELVPFEQLTPAKRMQAGMTNRRLGSLKQLDQNLKVAINEELARRGEVGLAQYERRFAALSQVRDQLQSRINAIELQRSNLMERVARSVIGGKRGIASASQAAVADVNIGRLLESGFENLRRSGLRPSRGTTTVPKSVRGLLEPSRMMAAGEPGGPSEVIGVPAAATVGRGPTGQFKKVFTSGSGPQTLGRFMGEIREAGGARWTWTGERWWRMR